MIFISHASADMPVVSLISDTILKAAFRIANNDIFFSSESETGMDGGDYINGKIFKKIDESNYILFILSPRYFDSYYCLCEMGAAKVLNKKVFLMVLPEMEFGDVKGVYDENLMKHLNEDGLDLLVESIRVNCQDIWREDSTVGLKRAVRKCVKELPATLKSLPPRKSISVVEHERLKAQNEEMNELLDERDEEITRLQTILDEIDAGGDPKEVKKAHRSVSLKNAFEELWNKATEQLDMLSIDGQRAFFYLYSQDSHAAYSMINDERLNIAPDVRKKFILAGEGEPYKLGKKSDPISEAMNDLSDFLDAENADAVADEYGATAKEVHEFLEWLEEKLECPLDLHDEDFWDAALFDTRTLRRMLAD